MTVFILIYLGIAGGLYFYNRSLILADLIQFSAQYKGIRAYSFERTGGSLCHCT